MVKTHSHPLLARRILFVPILFVLLFFTFVFPAESVSAATFEDINSPDVFITQDVTAGTCVLCSTTSMLRRRAMIDENKNWNDITQDDVATAALTGELMLNSFSYEGMSVTNEDLPPAIADKKAKLISLLNDHPEGIVFYNSSKPHAVLLTDYVPAEDSFYCADPAVGGREKLIDSTLGGGAQDDAIDGATSYWYITNKTDGMDAAEKPLEAVADADSNAINVLGDEHGTVGVSNITAGEGTKIALTAIPAVGYSFKGWIVTDGDVTLSDRTDPAATFEMPAGTVTIYATFVKDGDDLASGAGAAGGSDGSNVLSVMDIRNCVSGEGSIAGDKLLAADANDDGYINIFDILAVRGKIFG